VSLESTALPTAELLKSRRETIAIAESSAGGLIAASLLAVPGASSYFLGGAIIYTREARKIFLNLPMEKLQGIRPLSEEMAQIFAQTVKEDMGATWGIAELGVAGPSGTPYSDEVGITVIAVAGPVTASTTVRTGDDNREGNMHKFAKQALSLCENTIGQYDTNS
jgi:PncC family amidohydrolase|tara:strand:+ start:1699 stop:2193 length:495 start_codon:yes stop_codon:yes gene_type:complete